MKRLIFNYRNMGGLITQILLAVFFVTVVMTFALTIPGFADPLPIILSTGMFSHFNSLNTPVTGLSTHKPKNRQAQIDDTLSVNPFELFVKSSISESKQIDIEWFDGPLVWESLWRSSISLRRRWRDQMVEIFPKEEESTLGIASNIWENILRHRCHVVCWIMIAC